MPVLKEDNKKSFGKLGEDLAAEYLEKEGYRLLDRNYRAGRLGEIDIVAVQGEYLCFIEVKTRTGKLFGLPCEAVDGRKQSTLRKLALAYMKHKGLEGRNVRFDIVEVTGDKRDGEFIHININLIRNAF